MSDKIKVIYSLEKLKDVVTSNDSIFYCLYLAHKDKEGWKKSTSRVYMNNLLPGFVYQPVDIHKNDNEMIRKIYKFADKTPNTIAINQTQPHKSNPILKEYFNDKVIPNNIDALVKDISGKLVLYDLNGHSFIEWYESKVGCINNKTIILLGVGGVGEPIFRAIIGKNPKKVILVDKIDKSTLAAEFSRYDVEYFQSVDDVYYYLNDILFINAAGKEGVKNQSDVTKFLENYRGKGYLFIDLRPHLNIDVVEKAKKIGWRSYTGYGMNAANDYALIKKITSTIKIPVPSFVDFKERVRKAS